MGFRGGLGGFEAQETKVSGPKLRVLRFLTMIPGKSRPPWGKSSLRLVPGGGAPSAPRLPLPPGEIGGDVEIMVLDRPEAAWRTSPDKEG